MDKNDTKKAKHGCAAPGGDGKLARAQRSGKHARVHHHGLITKRNSAAQLIAVHVAGLAAELPHEHTARPEAHLFD